MESRRAKRKAGWGVSVKGGGHAKGQLLVRGFYWEWGGWRGAAVGVRVKDHRLRF